MSMISTMEINCSQCQTPFSMEVHKSINLERDSNLLKLILDDQLNKKSCPKCGQLHSTQPEFPVMDLKHKLWIAAWPNNQASQWQQIEEKSKQTFDLAFGSKAPQMIQTLAAEIKPRITFGWPALKEKLLVNYHLNNISDVVIELGKISIIKQFLNLPFIMTATLRLVEIQDGQLIFDWYDKKTDELIENRESAIASEVQFFESIRDNISDWSELKNQIDQGLYIDTKKLF